MIEPKKLPNSGIITLDPNVNISSNDSYQITGLDENGQVLLNIELKIVDESVFRPRTLSISLPLITSLNSRRVSVLINNQTLNKINVFGHKDWVTDSQIDFVNGADSIPFISASGFQSFNLVGTTMWQSLAETIIP